MFSFRLAAAAFAMTLPLALTNTGLAGGDVFLPAQRDVLAVQKHSVLPMQKHVVSPMQHPAPLPVQTYVPQKHVVAMPVQKVVCQPKITYRHHGCQKRRHCCCCELPYQVVLSVVDPKCCDRVYQIPVTVPPECLNMPWQKDRPGLFCRGVATFQWPCGYKVKVVMLRKGDVVVHTFGRKVSPTAVPRAIPVALPIESYPPTHSVYSPEPTPALPLPSQGPELVPPGGYAF